jgi:hypothetical protein
MASTAPWTGADASVLEKTQLRHVAARSVAPVCLVVCAVLCTTLVAGCARNPAQREYKVARHEVMVKPTPVTARTRYSEQSYAKPRSCRPAPALLAPQPAPDCEFNRPDTGAVDPNEWARLKIEYERQCYKDAEKAARDRLNVLQASSTCEPAGQSRTVR